MNQISIVILIIIALVLVYFKLIKPLFLARRKHYRHLKADLQDEQPLNTAKQLVAFLHKNCSMLCIEEDGKFYGSAFKNGQPPELPHDNNCRCRYEIILPRHSQVFSKKPQKKSYQTDLGELGFYEYKYYKYTLIIKLNPDSQLAAECMEFRNNLQVAPSFLDTLSKHLTK